jgi:hypothetical protein
VTLREKFSNWIAVSNRNRYLGLALTLLYAVRRGQCHIVLDLAEEMMDGSSDRAGESGHGDDWAMANRIMCAFLHRGGVAPTPCIMWVPGSLPLLLPMLRLIVDLSSERVALEGHHA